MAGMVVAPQPVAVEEGAKVLMKGGNAVDAAVTCALVQGVVSPQMCGIGGYLILTLHVASRTGGHRAISLDAPALAGSKVSAQMWEKKLIRPNPGGWGYFLEGKVNEQGYQSICAPGTAKGLNVMLERWGTLSWGQATGPAARLAEEGFRVDSHLAAGWKERRGRAESSTLLSRITANPESSRIYLKEDGAPYDVGEVLRNPDYGRTLRQLAERGPDDFYHGDLARRMSGDLTANGGFVTAEDLTGYEVRDAESLRGSYRGFPIDTAPPPHGGPTLLAILNILEGYDLVALGHNSPDYVHLVSMAMKAAFADRNPYMGDPVFAQVPAEWMISKDRAAEWRHTLTRQNLSTWPSQRPGRVIRRMSALWTTKVTASP